MKLLEDKVIIVTGGSKGIGFDCAKAYLEEGAKVIILARSSKEVAEAVTLLGSDAVGEAADVSNPRHIEDVINRAIKTFGRIDGIHNNAGIATPSKAVHETTEEEWDNLFNINLKSVYYTTKYAYEALKQSKGSILNTSSLVGVIGQEIHAAYTATKGGMNTLTKSMALDYAKVGIRVNAVCPAGTWTPTLRKWCTEQPNRSEIEQYLDDIHPLGYCPEGDVIADASAFLLSDKARFITGCILPVSGGAELGYRRMN